MTPSSARVRCRATAGAAVGVTLRRDPLAEVARPHGIALAGSASRTGKHALPGPGNQVAAELAAPRGKGAAPHNAGPGRQKGGRRPAGSMRRVSSALGPRVARLPAAFPAPAAATSLLPRRPPTASLSTASAGGWATSGAGWACPPASSLPPPPPADRLSTRCCLLGASTAGGTVAMAAAPFVIHSSGGPSRRMMTMIVAG